MKHEGVYESMILEDGCRLCCCIPNSPLIDVPGKKQEIMQQEKHGCVEFLAAQTTQQIRYFDGLQYQIVSERSREK